MFLKKTFVTLSLLSLVSMTPAFAESTNLISNDNIKRESMIIDLIDEAADSYLENKEYYDLLKPYLRGNLEGLEEIFVDYALELDVDPVLAVSISLHETGNGTSRLCVNSNNFGGMRGGDGWYEYDTAEEGAKSFIRLLSRYNNKGLSTPETMVNAYAEGSEHWVESVNEFYSNILEDAE